MGKINKFFKEAYQLIILLISIDGYVPKNATVSRTIAMGFSLAFAIYIGQYQPDNSSLSIVYFILSEVFYVGFLVLVLSKNGLRHWFIRRWGDEEEGYLAYEAILGFLFFHNGICMGYISSANPGSLFPFINQDLLFIITAVMVISGFAIKLLAAKAVTIEIYYLKDMFLGKKISDFVLTGPYKYFKNPMYGIGQLPAYAFAIWHGSLIGLIAAFLNQALVFSFFYLLEKKFIKRVYLKTESEPVTAADEAFVFVPEEK